MKTEVKPTIAWLWDRFQKLGNYIETEKFLQSWGTKGSDGLSHDGRNHSSDEVELQSLRQQLLERCKEVDDADRDTTKLWVCCDGDRLAIQTPGILEFVGSPKELRELGAACNFWAWELEQRQKENDRTRP